MSEKSLIQEIDEMFGDKNSDYNNLAERKEQLFLKQKDDFTNALVAAIDAANALGLDHSVELLLDSMIDDFCKEELNFSIGTYNNYPAFILGVKVK